MPVTDLFGDAWFETLATALARLAPGASPGDSAPGLALGQIVRGGPAGEVRYTIVLEPDGSASLVRGSVEAAAVTLVEEWSTAQLLATGATTVPEQLNLGRIRVLGDPRALVAASELLAKVAPALAEAVSSGHC